MVFKLLVLGRCMTYHGPVAKHQVRTSIEKGFIHKEIFLLYAEIHPDRLYILIEKLCNSGRRIAESLHGLQVRHLGVQGFTGI